MTRAVCVNRIRVTFDAWNNCIPRLVESVIASVHEFKGTYTLASDLAQLIVATQIYRKRRLSLLKEYELCFAVEVVKKAGGEGLDAVTVDDEMMETAKRVHPLFQGGEGV